MRASDENMADKSKRSDEMRDHYDFSGGVRGKYAARYGEGANVVCWRQMSRMYSPIRSR